MPEELETVAENLEEIEAEPGVNPYGESVVSETGESLDYAAIASEAIERAQYESLAAIYGEEETEAVLQTEEPTLSVEEDFLLQPEITSVLAAEPVRAAQIYDMPEAKAYKLNLDGTEYYAWFPSGAELVVTDEGYFYNGTASAITGVISTSLDGINLNGYNDFVTVAPLLSTSSNNNAYRYGSRVYITDYYVSGSNLLSTVSYVSSYSCVKEPGAGYGFSKYQLTIFGLLFLAILLLVIRWGKKL